MTEPSILALTTDHHDEAMAMIVEAFGEMPEGMAPPKPEELVGQGRHPWGVIEDGRLVARMVGLELRSWWHGREVPTCGVAGVSVAPEARGRGFVRPLFREVLAGAVERGEVVSTLFPSAPGVYRSSGYELVTSFDTVEIPTAELLAVRRPDEVRTRRAMAADVPAVKEVYDAWASAQHGPLTRRGPLFPDDEVICSFTGVSVAVDGKDRVVGYCQWNRGRGFGGPEARIDVADLVATTADAYRALWRMLGSFAPATPAVRIRTSGTDTARLVLPTITWRVVESLPYMLRLLDVARALSLLPARGLSGDVALQVVGDTVAGTDGRYRLTLTEDRVVGERIGPVADEPALPTFTPGGLALLWSGVQTCANVRAAGGLVGGRPEDDVLLDAACAGRPLHVRDHF